MAKLEAGKITVLKNKNHGFGELTEYPWTLIEGRPFRLTPSSMEDGFAAGEADMDDLEEADENCDIVCHLKKKFDWLFKKK